MQFVSGEGADTAEIRPSGPAPSLRVGGIDADGLQRLFTGRAARESWFAPGHTLTADNPWVGRADNPAETGPTIQNLPDGRAVLASAQPGRIEFDARHHRQELLLPQSLNLLLAQQWARSGCMPAHAAAFAFQGTTVLALGRKGGGKSILALAALAAGGGVVSDDWVLLAPEHDRIVAERMRDFLMTRSGWASQALIPAMPEGSFKATARPKQVHAIERDHRTASRFPPTAIIDRLWLLERPRGARGQISQRTPGNAAQALARLVEATMPILFSAAFPAERNALMTTLNTVVAGTAIHTIRTGTDLVEAPATTLDRLING